MKESESVWTRFQNLQVTGGAGVGSAISCGASDHHLLVRGEHGEPILLLASGPREMPRPDVRLKHVSVQFDRKFEVASTVAGATRIGQFCRFACDPGDRQLHRHFVELMVATARAHDVPLPSQEVDNIVDALLEMFRSLSIPSNQSLTGLWGELLIIHLATSPGLFVDAWHLRTTDGFDFSFADQRIEVKTTEGTSREHDFSLQQVRSGRSTDLIASVVLSRSSAGHSVFDLARLISERLTASHQSKLWSLVIATLGAEADIDDEHRFDLESAKDSLSFVLAADVPAPQVSATAAPFVADVRFRSNINVLCINTATGKIKVLGR